MTLNAPTEDLALPAVPETFPAAAGPLRILLAEDDVEVRSGLIAVLERQGYIVDAVADGSQLLERLAQWVLGEVKTQPADIIVTDVRMPGFDGFSVVEGLRDCGWTLPIVVISAFTDDRLDHRLQELGGVIFLPKPFEPRLLEETLASLAARSTEPR